METPRRTLTFNEFCKHFGEPTPKRYSPIVDAFIQYETDCFYGGPVSPDYYWH